tara:strand:+ start:35 stop:1324 length:1290 start_codon:yes stop_codon:yes gene_type:complete
MKIKQYIYTSSKNIFLISLMTFAITPFFFLFVAQHGTEFIATTSKFTKNVPRYPYLEELLGFGQHFSMRHDGSLKHYLTLSVALLCGCFSCSGFYISFKNRNLLFLSVFIFIFSLGGYFIAIDYTYHFYKNSIMGVFVIIPALVIGGHWLFRSTNVLMIKLLVLGTFTVFIGLNINTYIKDSILSSYPVITRSYINLKNISNILSGDNRVLINSRNPTEEVWLSYFLQDNKVKLRGSLEPWGFWIYAPVTGKPDFRYFYNYTTDNIDYTLSPKLRYKNDIVEIDYGKIVYENEEYLLSENIPDPFLLSGWYGLEKDNSGLFRWTEEKSDVLFNAPKHEATLDIKGHIPPVYSKPLEIQIKINGEIIESFFSDDSLVIDKSYLLSKLPVRKINNELSIVLNKSFIPNQLSGSADLRKLGIMIRKIEIIPL